MGRAGGIATGALACAAAAFPASVALAKTVQFTENASLHLTGSSGALLVEAGTARGTYNCAVTARFKINSTSRISGTFTVYPKGGSITGTASGRIVVAGRIAYYGGTMTISKGSGSFAHVHPTTIGVSGTIDRRTYALTVKTNGTLHV
jgi:phage baseplate assembly protein gpV